jgi:hypothetical protein
MITAPLLPSRERSATTRRVALDVELLDERVEGEVRLRPLRDLSLMGSRVQDRCLYRRAPHWSSLGTLAQMQSTFGVSQSCRQVFRFGGRPDPRFHATFR